MHPYSARTELVLSSSFSGYGKLGYVNTTTIMMAQSHFLFRFDRRFRIFDISDYGETIKTWKRTEHDDIVDEMILAGPGAAPPPQYI